MYRGKLDKADEIIIKMGHLIAERRRNLLSNVDATSTKQLLDSVKAAYCHRHICDELLSCVGDENVINNLLPILLRTPFIINRKSLTNWLLANKQRQLDYITWRTLKSSVCWLLLKRHLLGMNQFFHIVI